MIFEGIVLAVIFGYLRKGRIKNLENITIQYWGAFIFAFGMQTIAFVIASIPEDGFYLLHIGSYVLIVFVCIRNHRFIGMWLMGIGTFLNGLVIALNHGMMPVKLPIGAEPIFDRGHMLLTHTTQLGFLADIFVIEIPKLSTRVMSVGDFIIVVGVFHLVQQGMQAKRENNTV